MEGISTYAEIEMAPAARGRGWPTFQECIGSKACLNFVYDVDGR